jgi:hypothetical protein
MAERRLEPDLAGFWSGPGGRHRAREQSWQSLPLAGSASGERWFQQNELNRIVELVSTNREHLPGEWNEFFRT